MHHKPSLLRVVGLLINQFAQLHYFLLLSLDVSLHVLCKIIQQKNSKIRPYEYSPLSQIPILLGHMLRLWHICNSFFRWVALSISY